jgi:hypothetical protein
MQGSISEICIKAEIAGHQHKHVFRAGCSDAKTITNLPADDRLISNALSYVIEKFSLQSYSVCHVLFNRRTIMMTETSVNLFIFVFHNSIFQPPEQQELS